MLIGKKSGLLLEMKERNYRNAQKFYPEIRIYIVGEKIIPIRVLICFYNLFKFRSRFSPAIGDHLATISPIF